MKLAPLIKRIRARHGWSQAQMAKALNLSKPTISLYESGKRSISKRAVQTYHRLFAHANPEEQQLLREWLK